MLPSGGPTKTGCLPACLTGIAQHVVCLLAWGIARQLVAARATDCSAPAKPRRHTRPTALAGAAAPRRAASHGGASRASVALPGCVASVEVRPPLRVTRWVPEPISQPPAWVHPGRRSLRHQMAARVRRHRAGNVGDAPSPPRVHRHRAAKCPSWPPAHAGERAYEPYGDTPSWRRYGRGRPGPPRSDPAPIRRHSRPASYMCVEARQAVTYQPPPRRQSAPSQQASPQRPRGSHRRAPGRLANDGELKALDKGLRPAEYERLPYHRPQGWACQGARGDTSAAASSRGPTSGGPEHDVCVAI